MPPETPPAPGAASGLVIVMDGAPCVIPQAVEAEGPAAVMAYLRQQAGTPAPAAKDGD